MSTGAGGLFRRIETLLGIKPKPARRSVPLAAPATGARGTGTPLPDLFALIVTGATIAAGCGLALIAMIAGRRKG